ncbi:hypothetical protein MC885_008312 [Smutsia gigantea]|nr:hypothetical protein MC885_008312 [Smutsia gigantea]
MSPGGTGAAQRRCSGRTWSHLVCEEPPFLEQVVVSLLVEGRDLETSVLLTVSGHRNSLGQRGLWMAMRKEPRFGLGAAFPSVRWACALGSTTSPSSLESSFPEVIDEAQHL